MPIKPNQPAMVPAGLSSEAYLAELRDALRSELRGEVIGELRGGIDEWNFGGIDPFEPLTNRGRRTISWDYPEWHSISGDLLSQLESTVVGDDPRISLKELPAELACYMGYVALELCAHHDPLYDLLHRAVFLPLIVAGRKKTEPTHYLRYLIGLFDRRDTLDQRAITHAELVQTMAFGIALGSADDPVIGHRVREIRLWLQQRITSAEGCFRETVPASWRPLWTAAVAASSHDAQAWMHTVMK